MPLGDVVEVEADVEVVDGVELVVLLEVVGTDVDVDGGTVDKFGVVETEVEVLGVLDVVELMGEDVFVVVTGVDVDGLVDVVAAELLDCVGVAELVDKVVVLYVVGVDKRVVLVTGELEELLEVAAEDVVECDVLELV